MKRSKLNPRSEKMSIRMKEYNKLRIQYLSKFVRCAVYPQKASTQIHHTRGRLGNMLCDIKWWLPVSQEGHRWIHDNPAEARTRGLDFSKFGIVVDIEDLLVYKFFPLV